MNFFYRFQTSKNESTDEFSQSIVLCIYSVYNDQEMQKNKTLITLRINNEMLEKWDKFCKNQELRRSDLIRTAVNNYITTSSGETIETLIDDLLHSQTQNLSKKIQDLSLLFVSESEKMKSLLTHLVAWADTESDMASQLEKKSKKVRKI